MNFYSEVLPILLIWAALIAGGGIAWWRKARKTACCLWATVVWMVVGTWWSSRQTPEGRQTAIKNACIAYLKQIDGAVQQWAQDEGKQATNTYTFSDPVLLSYMKGSVLPTGPPGCHYSPGATVADAPKCSLAAIGHTL